MKHTICCNDLALNRQMKEAWAALAKCRNNPWKGLSTMEILKKIRAD